MEGGVTRVWPLVIAASLSDGDPRRVFTAEDMTFKSLFGMNPMLGLHAGLFAVSLSFATQFLVQLKLLFISPPPAKAKTA